MPATTPYFKQLQADQLLAIAHIIKRCRQKGITNPLSIAAILAIISKESEFRVTREKSYRNTKVASIRKLFGDRLINYTDEAINILKKNDQEFFEAVYGYTTDKGKKNGNLKPGDGYKYRGAWFNQVTFYNNMKKIGDQLGLNLVSDPDKFLTVEVATDVALQYFFNSFAKIPKANLAYYKTTGINGFTELVLATKCFYNSNAGWGKTPQQLEQSTATGRKLALERCHGFLIMVNEQK